MQKKMIIIVAILSIYFLGMGISFAAPIDIAKPEFVHFADFTNDWPAADLSRISDPNPPTAYSTNWFGWHDSPTEHYPEYAGILLDKAYTVLTLRFQVHTNPFRDFVFQGSNDTTTGFDGTWQDVFSGTVTQQPDLQWQEWSLSNSNSFDAYRVKILNGYAGGWAMFRWDLLAEPVPSVPEPATMLLLGLGLIGLAGVRRKFKK